MPAVPPNPWTDPDKYDAWLAAELAARPAGDDKLELLRAETARLAELQRP